VAGDLPVSSSCVVVLVLSIKPVIFHGVTRSAGHDAERIGPA
jgi:hypothetical protein